ncbi:MAG: DUF1330 domain-containing protein [Dehalococcoidia bacterium]
MAEGAGDYAAALRRVPWTPRGFSDQGSPEANVAALLAWAEAHPGPEAEAIDWALGSFRATVPAPQTQTQGATMSVYAIFYQDAVTDREGLAAYQQQAGPTIAPFKPAAKVVTEANIETIEGDWKPARIVMLEFATKEDALGWHKSPAYGEVMKLRHAATKGGGGILVETLPIPGGHPKPVYGIFFQDAIHDQNALNEYQQKAGPTLGAYQCIPRVATTAVEHLEGDWPAVRVVVLEFPDRETAKAWHSSPEYSAVKGIRLNATHGAGVLVDGIPAR